MDNLPPQLNCLKRTQSVSSLTREGILSNLPKNSINKCWESLGNSVLSNYQHGKGTIIPKFGSFTYTHPCLGLEGSSNQIERDKKPVIPVFIVSSEFCEGIKPGSYTEKGIVLYQQKENNLIPNTKINYSELALSLNMNKLDYSMIIDHILKFISESIQKRIFKNKELPGIGALMLKNDILGVKFNEYLFDNVKFIPQQVIQARKDVKGFLEINPELRNSSQEKNTNILMNKVSLTSEVKNHLTKSLINLRPKSTFIQVIKKEAPNQINNEDKFQSEKFINDIKSSLKITTKLEDLNLDNSLLKSLYFHKNYLKRELKSKDINNKKQLSSQDIFRVLYKSNIEGLNQDHIRNIMKIYNSNNNEIDYSFFLESLLKDVSDLLNKNSTNFKADLNLKSLTSSQIEFPNVKLIDSNIDLNEVKNELRTIKSVLNKIKTKYQTRIDQNISHTELLNVIRDFNVVFPKEKIIKILLYLDLIPSNFSLKSFICNLEKSKILINDITTEDINNTKVKIKNLIFASGKSADELFNNFATNNALTLENFNDLITSHSKETIFNDLLIKSLFYNITKSSKKLSLEEFKNEFLKNNNDFEMKSINKILEKIRQRNITPDEYFDILLSYKTQKHGNFLYKSEFMKALQIENYNFTLQELSTLFHYFDIKKDDTIDKDEWNTKLKTPSDPLLRIQEIIKKNNLDIEDILNRMQIDPNKNESLDYTTFKTKMRLLDITLEPTYINALFNRIKNNTDSVDKNTIQHSFNVYKNEIFRDLNVIGFKKNFAAHIKSVSSLVQMQSHMEKYDRLFNGLVDKLDFCKAIQLVTKEFKDEDIMRFIRLSDLFKGHQKVKYSKFLEMIFYDDQVNYFNSMLSVLKNQFFNCNCNLINFAKEITGKGVNNITLIEISEMYNYLKFFIRDINKSIVCKLDMDQDGKISLHDLKNVLEKYTKTNFFKYENDDENLEAKLINNEVLDEIKFKEIVKEIKLSMKNRNLSVMGLFKKLDSNNDGILTITEFCHNIDSVIHVAPHFKEMLFNFLDKRTVGMIDYETFKITFKEYSSEEKINSNNWDIENMILKEFKNWIINNPNLSETDIFNLLTSRLDGKIVPEDFSDFILSKLLITKSEINSFKVERAMTLISISKNKILGVNDIRHFVNKVKSKNSMTDFFKTSVILSNMHKNKDSWVDPALEKLGYYITDVFGDIETFFVKYSGSSEIMTLEQFLEFNKEHYNCFEGFNLSDDELFVLYSYIDPHKKGHTTLSDFKVKLEDFNFYDKMHQEIKSYFNTLFSKPYEAFKYLNSPNDKSERKYLTYKQIFDGINNIFTNKYTTNQINFYLKSRFKNEKIEFSEFVFIYYDKIDSEEKTLKRNSVFSKSAVNFKTRSKSLNSTPFDDNPIQKLKKILKSSKYDAHEYFKIYQVLTDGKLNVNEFINMIKKLNLGFTLLEINYILARLERTKDGLINMNEFLKYLQKDDEHSKQMIVSINKTLSYMKTLISKYYSHPIICFQNNDPKNLGMFDFDTFKNFINELYKLENTQSPPPHITLKNVFDYIDIRKDGIIDLNEWLKTFGTTVSTVEKKLDPKKENICNELRQWENSKDIAYLFQIFAKNRKQIKDNTKNYTIMANLIKSDNLIKILRDMFPQIKLSNTQWKMLVSLGDKSCKDEIKLDLFFEIMNNSAKHNISHMKI